MAARKITCTITAAGGAKAKQERTVPHETPQLSAAEIALGLLKGIVAEEKEAGNPFRAPFIMVLKVEKMADGD